MRRAGSLYLICAAGVLASPLSLLAACSDDGGDDGVNVDENRIVYEARGPNATNIYVIDPDSGEFEQLTHNTMAGNDGQPAWKPDHTRIIFTSDRELGRDNTDVYTMLADGSDIQRITNTPGQSERAPKYSPDGERIGYVIHRDDEYFLAVSASDGTDEQVIAGPLKFIEFPSWTRDGREIYFAGMNDDTQGLDILSIDVESHELRTRLSTPGADVCPHLTHDGKYMTYARAPQEPNEQPDIFRHDLASDDTSGASDEQLTNDEARDDYANPSPDDSRFVFLSNRDDVFDLYLMDSDGGNVTRLTSTIDLRENVPDW